ncbi:MAG: hypothetical protein AB7V42_08610 [Thermoleophilia bacterium]
MMGRRGGGDRGRRLARRAAAILTLVAATAAPAIASAVPAGSEYPSSWTLTSATTATGTTPLGITVTATLRQPSAGQARWASGSSGGLTFEGPYPPFFPPTTAEALQPLITGCSAAPCGGITYGYSRPVLAPSLYVSDIGGGTGNGGGTNFTSWHAHPLGIAGGGTFREDSPGSQIGAELRGGGAVIGATDVAARRTGRYGTASCATAAQGGFGCGAYTMSLPGEAITALTLDFGYEGTGNTGDAFPLVVPAVPSDPRLVLAKTAAPETIHAVGDPVAYGFTVTNTGNVTLRDVSVADAFAPPSSGPHGPVTCAATTLAAGASTTCAAPPYRATQADVDAGVINNSAVATARPPAGPAVSSPPSTATVAVRPLADLAIAKTATSGAVTPGRDLTYSLVVTNSGPSPAAGVTVSDRLPAGLSFVSASDGCLNDGPDVTCARPSLAAGASATFSIAARVASSVDHAIENTAVVESPTPDPDPSDNAATLRLPLRAVANLRIAKTASTTAPARGGQVLYTLVVRNDGPSDATGVAVRDPGAAGLAIDSAATARGTCAVADGALSCAVGRLPAGGGTQILVAATVAPDAAGPITNTASVTGDQRDPESGDDRAAATITPSPDPQPVADLEVTKSANRERAPAGQPITYTIVVANRGPDAAPGVGITDTFGRPVRVISVRTTAGSCARARSATCSLGTLAPGARATVTIVAAPRAGGTLVNAVSATAAAADPSPPDNLARVASAVARPVLRVAKSAGATAVRAGGRLTYAIRVANPSRVALRRVAVCDRLPSGLVFVSAAPRATLSSGRLCWRIAALGPGRSRTYRLTVRALAGASGTRVNTAVATSPDAGTGRATQTVRVFGARYRPGGVTG